MVSERGWREPDSLRYELKMACQEGARPQVLMALQMHRAAVRPLHPTRVVQSLYLDTATGAALEENLSGVSHREKLRFRWYGEDSALVRGTLERKVRENMLGWKDFARVRTPLALAGVDRWTFLRKLAAELPPAWQAEVPGCLEPVQWIRYTREYYTTADGAVRITVDSQLGAWDQRPRFRLGCSGASFLPRLLIVEAKCAKPHYQAAKELLESLPLVVDRCSKFVLASDSAHGPVASLFPY